ncbi:hypothetical protein MTR67_047605 [Solanum verrucosum]|uniref:serine C-palmitoyltransferase n=2 Tax=Solanum TaxID=4107 RepID=A0AAF0UWT0_SOLVR|nr:hypothetical protein MTR67_047605 [Solanum verrucosum]
MDNLTPALISNQIVSAGSSRKFMVRTILPSTIPPSYRGATIRYLYYVRSILSGQYLIMENGHFSEESIRDLAELSCPASLVTCSCDCMSDFSQLVNLGFVKNATMLLFSLVVIVRCVQSLLLLETRIPLQLWVTQKSNGLQSEEGRSSGIVPASTLLLDVYWKEMDADTDWAKINETFDGVEEGYESSRDEVSSVSSYNPMKDNIHRTFGSSLSLRSSLARTSSKDLPHLEGRSSISSQLALPQIAVADVLYDSNGADALSPSQQLKSTKAFSKYDDSMVPSVSGMGESGASEGFIRGRSYNIRLDDQVLLRFSPKNSESTYYFSDMIGGTLTFFHEEGSRRCLELSITLEMTETISRRYVHPSRRHAPSITKVHSDHHEVVADLVQTSFLFSIPMDGPMSFSTHYVSVQWALRFEFFTTPKNADWSRYEHPLLVEGREKCEWVLPITVHAPPGGAPAAQTRNDRGQSLQWQHNNYSSGAINAPSSSIYCVHTFFVHSTPNIYRPVHLNQSCRYTHCEKLKCLAPLLLRYLTGNPWSLPTRGSSSQSVFFPFSAINAHYIYIYIFNSKSPFQNQESPNTPFKILNWVIRLSLKSPLKLQESLFQPCLPLAYIMDTTISVLTNKLRDASDWVAWISEAPFARAVVFGVNIGGHLFVEGLLLVVILFLLSQKSYKPPKRPLTKKEIDELCEEWVPEPLIPTITDEMKSEPPVLESAAGPHTTVNGKEVINFTSANYLGLLGNEKLLEACTRALEKYGVGSCGPRGFYGTIDVHLDCEARIAKFLGTPDSILYSYGLSTMFSAIPAFCKKGDVIVADEGVHWGIQNGLQLSRSTIIYFKHNDMESLRNTLEKITQENKLAKKLRRYIIVEAVYQNSGQIAPLDEIIKLKEKYKFRVLLDESNSLGVLGSSGKGLTEYYNVPVDKIDIITAAMGHALATEGGFCTGSTRVIEHQRLSSSGYVFSASLPPYLASAAVKAFDILEENPDLITKLRENINILFKGLQDIHGMEIMSDPLSPIVFLRLKKSTGSSKSDLKLLEDIADRVLKEDSVFVVTSKRSTLDKCKLPVGLRLFVSAGHSESDLEKASKSLKRVAASLLTDQS